MNLSWGPLQFFVPRFFLEQVWEPTLLMENSKAVEVNLSIFGITNKQIIVF
jgi:hypothetical protein